MSTVGIELNKPQKQTAQTPAPSPGDWLNEHGDFLYGFALSRLRNADLAEEVVQDTFVAGLKNVKQFKGSGTERAWLLGILKRKIIDVSRKRKRDPINVEDEKGSIADRLFDTKGSWRKEVRPTMMQSLDSVDREELWQILRRCLKMLPQRQADAFTLRTLDGSSSDQVCKELGITPNNYWVMLHRARLQLSGCVKQHWLDGGEE